MKLLTEKTAQLNVEDDGMGRGDGSSPKGSGLGTRIVGAMAASMGAQIHYLEASPGTTASLVFPLEGG